MRIEDPRFHRLVADGSRGMAKLRRRSPAFRPFDLRDLGAERVLDLARSADRPSIQTSRSSRSMSSGRDRHRLQIPDRSLQTGRAAAPEHNSQARWAASLRGELIENLSLLVATELGEKPSLERGDHDRVAPRILQQRVFAARVELDDERIARRTAGLRPTIADWSS